MDPPSKRRKLAPKHAGAESLPSLAAVTGAAYEATSSQEPRSAIPPERHDFESFARHLQDAAMLIVRSMQRTAPAPTLPPTRPSALLLSWDADDSATAMIRVLEETSQQDFRYQTEVWRIPKTSNATFELLQRLRMFLDGASTGQPSLIYYTGMSRQDTAGEAQWMSANNEQASIVDTKQVFDLLRDATPDLLLCFDTGVTVEEPVSGRGGSKQVIASHSIGEEAASQSYTDLLVESLRGLRPDAPFTAQRLFDEMSKRRQDLAQSESADGAEASHSKGNNNLVFFDLTTNHGAPFRLAPAAQTPQIEQDGHHEAAASPKADSIADLTFSEARVLVCTTFVGDADPDLGFFNEWLQSSPPIASRISMEGMFLGPPTMLLISMPESLWNIVQHDKVCCFIGFINSHNMIDHYKKLVGPAHTPHLNSQSMDDGRILLEAREAAANSPLNKRRYGSWGLLPGQPENPTRYDGPQRNPLPNSAPSSSATVKNDVEDSAEMKEAAEQLKALSHVRHLGDGSPKANGRRISGYPSVNGRSPTDALGSDAYLAAKALNGVSKPQRQFIQKLTPNQETRCTLCAHPPFKDGSSLRKHVAAAHTRPFPCAFSFAGCESTFGSKNEWKRHIASQHLCLQCYRCSQCQPSGADGKGNEFNRKDLFTQHLRRMHAPFAIKKPLAKGDGKLQADWESHVKEMQQTCLVTRRRPPQRASCPKEDCQSSFEGATSWDEWTEHVGRHMEKGEGARLGVDELLAQWALDEGIIEKGKVEGQYKLCGNGNGGGGGGTMVNGVGSLAPRENGVADASMVSEPSHLEDEAREIVAAA